MGEDQRRGVVQQRLAQHFARMHAGAVDGAAEQLLERDQPVTVVEVQAAEHLVGAVAQLRQQEGARRLRGGERRPAAQRFAEVPPRELHGGLEHGEARRSDARCVRQRGGSAFSRLRSEPNSQISVRAKSTAERPRTPEPSSSASSSASESACAPRSSSFSRGRSAPGQSRMLMPQCKETAGRSSRRRKRCV